MRNARRILNGDQTRWGHNFFLQSWPTPPALGKIIVTAAMPTSHLLALANLLVRRSSVLLKMRNHEICRYSRRHNFEKNFRKSGNDWQKRESLCARLRPFRINVKENCIELFYAESVVVIDIFAHRENLHTCLTQRTKTITSDAWRRTSFVQAANGASITIWNVTAFPTAPITPMNIRTRHTSAVCIPYAYVITCAP